MRKVIPVAYKQAQFIQFEAFKGVENNVDKFRIDILKFCNFRAVVNGVQVLRSFVNGNQWLIPFELLKELINWLIYNWYDPNYLFHYFVLDHNVAFGFDDSDIRIIILLLIYNRIFCVSFCLNLGQSTLKPRVSRICQWLYALHVRLKLCRVFCVILWVQVCKWWLLWV